MRKSSGTSMNRPCAPIVTINVSGSSSTTILTTYATPEVLTLTSIRSRKRFEIIAKRINVEIFDAGIVGNLLIGNSIATSYFILPDLLQFFGINHT